MRFSLIAGAWLGLGLLLGGCEHAGNRREARREAFEPLRPEPQYRILPVRPAASSRARTAPDPRTAITPPHSVEPIKAELEIRHSLELDRLGLKPTVSRLNGHQLEVYFVAEQPVRRTVLARALDAENREIGRAPAPVKLEREEAAYIRFQFPPELVPGELRAISLEPAAAEAR